jgi:tRNA (guanine9-N1)-methyltransferase
MIKWLDCRDWEKAFLEVIPDRKLKDSTVLNRDGEEEEEEEEEDLEDLEEDDIVEEET